MKKMTFIEKMIKAIRDLFNLDKCETLHEAIDKVLDKNDCEFMTFEEIAEQIKEQDLWKRPTDGQYPPPYQIKLRTTVQKDYKQRYEFKKPNEIRLK